MFRRCLKPTVVLITLLPCAALGAEPNAPIRVGDYQGTVRVACVGDSITAGVGAAKGESHPAQLSKMPGEPWNVRNFGINEAGVRDEAPMIDKVAQETPAGVIDMHAALKTHPEMLPDRVHPNTAGATRMAKAAYKALAGKEFSGSVPAAARRAKAA